MSNVVNLPTPRVASFGPLDAVNRAYVDSRIGNASVFVGPSPPPSPIPGQLWWRDTDAIMFIYYDDGTNIQWVQT
jgi:hypothetical protein